MPALHICVQVAVPTGFLTSVGKFLANLVQQKALHRGCNACNRDEHASYMITSPRNQYRDHHTRCLLLSMFASYRHIKERIKKAVDDLQTQSKPNIAATTRKFNVPRQRLQYRFRRNSSKIESGGQNKKLSEAQEKAICQFLDHFDSNGLKARYKQLEQVANSLLTKDHQGKGSPPTVGSHWAERFPKQNPQYFVHKQKPLAVERRNAESPETNQAAL